MTENLETFGCYLLRRADYRSVTGAFSEHINVLFVKVDIKDVSYWVSPAVEIGMAWLQFNVKKGSIIVVIFRSNQR